VGGSVIIIPGLIIYMGFTKAGYTGSKQHLLQATAMICNVFISAPAVLAHRRAGAIMKPVISRLIPAALVGIFVGVALSNHSVFAQDQGRYLAMVLAGFMGYVALYNIWRLFSKTNLTAQHDEARKITGWKIICVGVPMGLAAGLLGIGGGALCVPAQQIILRIPLRRAIANSATTIVFTAIFGAIYKNITLAEHQIAVQDSLRLAVTLIPTAMLGGFLGGRLTHKMPRQTLRVVFIIFMAVTAILIFRKAKTATREEIPEKTSAVDYLRSSRADNSEFLRSPETPTKATVETNSAANNRQRAEASASKERVREQARAMAAVAPAVFSKVEPRWEVTWRSKRCKRIFNKIPT
jgi:uncharacterized membrane protein YfcA